MSAMLTTPPSRPPSIPSVTPPHSLPAAGHVDESSTAPRLRLTRRGRLVLLIVFLLAVLGAFSMGRASGSADAARLPTPSNSVVVGPGDTLWGIARRAVPQADPRAVVQRIKAVNGLSSADLSVGQRLRLPGTDG